MLDSSEDNHGNPMTDTGLDLCSEICTYGKF